MPLALWCGTCCAALCRACATPQEHPGHQIKSQTDAKEQLISDVNIKKFHILVFHSKHNVKYTYITALINKTSPSY